MAGVNKVILVGHLGKDPEVRDLESGAKVASFSLATSESYKDKTSGERVDKTEWHNIVLWRGLADVAERFLKKGSLIYLEGKIQNRSYDDKEGITRYTTEILGQNLTMLGAKGDNAGGAPAPTVLNEPKTDSVTATTESDPTDDLPF